MTGRAGTVVAVLAAAVAAFACATFAATAVTAVRADARTPSAHIVEIRRFTFPPVPGDVAPGDTVRWINRDPVPHTVTARDSTWDSGRIAPGGTWSRVVEGTVTEEYFCEYHPTMTGRLTRPDARGR